MMFWFLVVCNFCLFLYCKITNFLFIHQIFPLKFLVFLQKKVRFFVFDAKIGVLDEKTTHFRKWMASRK